eukprot:4129170-Karenia_brevis.AAC.1
MSDRVSKLEASSHRMVVVVSPWQHNDQGLFWSQFHSLMGGDTMDELLKAGKILTINDAFYMRVELAVFQASQQGSLLQQMRASVQRLGLRLN